MPFGQSASSHTLFRRAREHTRSAFHRAAETIDPYEPLASRHSYAGVTRRSSIAHPFAQDSPRPPRQRQAWALRGLDFRLTSDLSIVGAPSARDACGR